MCHGLLKKRNNLQQNLEELQKSMGTRKLALFSCWKIRVKWGWQPTRLLRFVTFVHLPFSFRSLDLFVASLLFMKGASCCVIRRNWSRQIVLWQIFKRSQLCMISAVCICMSLRRVWHLICHVLVRCFVTFLLQDMFLSLQVLILRDRIWHLLRTCCLLAYFLYCEAVLGCD